MGAAGDGINWKSHFYALLCAIFSASTIGCSGGGGAPASAPPPPASSVTLSGTIGIAAGAAVDSDVNDPFATYISNDSYTIAQSLSGITTLGGYLNVAGTGFKGNSFSPGDISDFYSISLVAGQAITVTLGDPLAGDLDLYLYHADGSIDPAAPDYGSEGTGQVETITVPASGDYFIEVYAYAGYTNYTLTVGETAPLHVSGRLVSTDDFVPGDVIIKFRDDPSASVNIQTPALRAATLGLQASVGNGRQRSQLMNLGASHRRKATFDKLGVKRGSGHRQHRFSDPEKQLKFETMQVIKSLRKRADVLYAEPNYIHQASAVPTDPLYSSQWHYPMINLPTAWDLETGASNVTVAVVDTGVLLAHPDLLGQFSADGGYDFISDATNSGDGEPGIDANPDDTGDDNGSGRSSFHGTHVAGTVAAATAFSAGGSGVAGVAPGVKIMPIRVLGKQGGTSYDILQGVRYAAGLSNDSGITLNAAQRADVINLSLGRAGGFTQIEQDLYTEVRNAGVVVTAAAGNGNSSVLNYPAAYAGVISVAAVDFNKQKAPYSNFGSTIDVAAPGGNTATNINGDSYGDGVLSTLGDDSGATVSYGYDVHDGTSMAAPHMAGVVALMKSSYSELTPANVDALLQSGAIVEDLGTAGRDDSFGHGLIDAYKAVVAAQSGAPFPAALEVSPAVLNLGSVERAALLAVNNVGSGALTVNSVNVSGAPGWLTVGEVSVDTTSKLGLYRVTIDRSDLPEGIYQADIVFSSSSNSVTVPVSMQVVSLGLSMDAGYHYVLLVDAVDLSLADQWQGAAQGGVYQYRFENVTFPTGRKYYVIGGTDLDNDLEICDPGEACGIYASVGDFRSIGADDAHSGLDFITGFGVGGQASALLEAVKAARGIKRSTTTTKIPQKNR